MAWIGVKESPTCSWENPRPSCFKEISGFKAGLYKLKRHRVRFRGTVLVSIWEVSQWCYFASQQEFLRIWCFRQRQEENENVSIEVFGHFCSETFVSNSPLVLKKRTFLGRYSFSPLHLLLFRVMTSVIWEKKSPLLTCCEMYFPCWQVLSSIDEP